MTNGSQKSGQRTAIVIFHWSFVICQIGITGRERVAMAKIDEFMIGVDLGGTSMMVVALDSKGKILADRARSTKPELGADKVMERIADTVEKLLFDIGKGVRKAEGVCVGAPGVIDRENGLVVRSPNLNWTEYPLAKKLSQLLHSPVVLDNDVNAGAVGEHVLGAGRGARNMVAIFVGTGIGGGVIINDELYYGGRGSAGEVGHMKILADGPVCGCGRRGCVEALASRTAMERDVESALKAGRESAIPEIMKRDNRDRMTSSVIQEALQSRDALMEEVLRRAQLYLGLLVASVVNLLDPQCVVIGGGIVERLKEDFLKPVQMTAYEHFLRVKDSNRVKIVASELGDHAGAAGAAVLAWRALKGMDLRTSSMTNDK